MTDEIPRRAKPKHAPEMPSGYRSSRRGSKSAKWAKWAERGHRVTSALDGVTRTVRNIAYLMAIALGGLLVLVLVLLLLASAINGIARWSARRTAARSGSVSELERLTKENLLVIGVDKGKAIGFLALRVDQKGGQVFGIAIPDGAFIEVPGQGFERVGESYVAGAEVSLAAISNYLTVPFRSYITVPAEVYRDALKRQTVAGITAARELTNASDAQLADISRALASIQQKNTALVPLPVKPIKLGDQTYFEPQRAEVADLLKAWWGVDATTSAQVTRIILYNGAGKPGVAGEAAQQLIRNGFRVVDTKNANNFGYKQTIVIVQRGSVSQGDKIVSVLRTGIVKEQPSDQDVADVIVIIGKDYTPPAQGAQGGTK